MHEARDANGSRFNNKPEQMEAGGSALHMEKKCQQQYGKLETWKNIDMEILIFFVQSVARLACFKFSFLPVGKSCIVV